MRGRKINTHAASSPEEEVVVVVVVYRVLAMFAGGSLVVPHGIMVRRFPHYFSMFFTFGSF